MRNKKLFGIIILSIIVISLSTCDQDGTHTHNWGEWTLTTAANCTTAGIETRICSTDASHTETRFVPINSNAHVWGNWLVSIPVTETTDGLETGTCIHNSSHTETRVIIALNHTCLWGGWSWTTAPTCTTTGVEMRMCNHNSSHRETRNVPVDLINGHNWGNWITTTAPTQTRDGVETATCTHNSSHNETRPIQHTTHNWGNWIVTTPAGCTTDGIERRTCSHIAPHNETRPTHPIGHSWQWVGTVSCIRGDVNVFTDTQTLRNALESLPLHNTVPYTVKINMDLARWQIPFESDIRIALSLGGRYDAPSIFPPGITRYSLSLSVDLSGSTGTLIGMNTSDGVSYRNYPVVSLVLPNSLTRIGHYAFYNFKDLRNIIIPSNVTSIGDWAFAYCENLESITIPASVTSIGDRAFIGCDNLVSVTLNGASIPVSQFPGNLYWVYLEGGIGTYTRALGSDTWTKQ
jgi:hypothetical protein